MKTPTEPVESGRLRRLAVSALAGLSLVIGLSGGWVWSQQTLGPRPLQVGVVNLKEVFLQYEKAKDFEAEIEREKKAAESRIEKIEVEMKDLMAAIDQIRKANPGSALLSDKQEKLVQHNALREYMAKDWNYEVKDRINRNTISLYNEIRKEVATFALANGFDLIFKVETPDLDATSEEPANVLINRRPLIYNDQTMDITNAIVQRLNEKHARLGGTPDSGGGIGPQPPKPPK